MRCLTGLSWSNNLGYVRHNWKTRWFVLFDDALRYYKRKEDTIFAGEVHLRGCSLVAPCPDYTKKSFVFRLISSNGREYLLQAASEGELQLWSASIAAAIRKAESKQRSERKPKSSENINEIQESSELKVKLPLPSFAELIEAMQDRGAGIALETHEVQDSKVYRHCFSGTQVVDWLISWSFVEGRMEGVEVGNGLLEQGHLQPVGLRSRNSFKERVTDRRRTGEKNAFCDATNALYRFSALRLANSEVFETESDESSDSEDSDKEHQAKSIEGVTVKQGFLVKKGHMRHNWKTRKFVLCEQPAKLYYCKPTKPDCPLGCIKLTGAKIERITEESVDGEKKSKHFYGYRFRIRTWKETQYVLQAGSKEELEEWISILESVCNI
ncbi:pleckstrin-2-like isoform X2 [Dendronephthya gigantea]|uniref:pleckstrin-2-like isoform X2 n=1 Tax=Dendronephthya gigantea TaxID=151771 RepID=UPI00106A9C23|nr:pleckstrin-2-like isoform X2 [Dendronephthya gigantea]